MRNVGQEKSWAKKVGVRELQSWTRAKLDNTILIRVKLDRTSHLAAASRCSQDRQYLLFISNIGYFLSQSFQIWWIDSLTQNHMGYQKTHKQSLSHIFPLWHFIMQIFKFKPASIMDIVSISSNHPSMTPIGSIKFRGKVCLNMAVLRSLM